MTPPAAYVSRLLAPYVCDNGGIIAWQDYYLIVFVVSTIPIEMSQVITLLIMDYGKEGLFMSLTVYLLCLKDAILPIPLYLPQSLIPHF